MLIPLTWLASWPANLLSVPILGTSKQAAPTGTKQEVSKLEQEDLDYCTLAENHHEAGEFLEAISAYQLALIEDPQNPAIWFGLAAALYEVNQTQEAIESYQEALNLNPHLWQAEMNLGVIWFNEKNFGQALSHFQRVQRLTPESSKPFLMTGRIQLLQGDLNGAEASYKKALELAEEPVEKVTIHLDLASIYLKKKEHSTAVKYLVASRAFSKDTTKIDRQLANLYLEMDQKNKALEYLERLATETTVGPELDETIGWIRVEQKDYEQGIKSLRIALQKYQNPKQREELSLKLARLHIHLEQIDEAITILENSASNSTNPEVYFTLGSLYLHSGQRKPAKRYLSQALQLNSDCVECYLKLGIISMRQEDFSQAIHFFVRYQGLRPEEVMPYFYLGIAYDKLQDYLMAVTQYENFLEMDKGTHDRESFQVRQRLKLLKKKIERR